MARTAGRTTAGTMPRIRQPTKIPEADKRRQTKGIADEETEMPEKYGAVPSAKILDNTVSHSHMPAMKAKGKSTCGMLHIWKSIKKGFRQ